MSEDFAVAVVLNGLPYTNATERSYNVHPGRT